MQSYYRHKYAFALLLALLLHGLVVFLIPWLSKAMPRPVVKTHTRITFAPKKNTSVQKELANKSVVSIVPDKDELRPKDAKYLSTHDQSTKHEQKAPQSNFKKENIPQRTPSAAPKKNLAGKTNKDPLGIFPTFSEYAPSSASSFTDALPELKTGSRTELNAWQWRHAPFFNRIKAKVGQIWSPQQQIYRYDPKGELLGQKDRVTIVKVTIDESGYLTDLLITNESGVAYLDEEAKRTFRAAAPFLFPPKELFAKNHEFSFQFGFYLQVNRGLSFDFDWHNL